MDEKNVWKGDDEKYVLGTTVTWVNIEKKLKESLKIQYANFGPNKKVESIGTGQGFMSVLARFYPDWTDSSNELPETVILKIPSEVVVQSYMDSTNMEDKIWKNEKIDREKMMEARRNAIKKIHNTETGFYKFVAKENLKIPRGYVMESVKDAGEEAVLIMEDLKEERVIPIFENISVDECTQVVEALAKVHALSLKDNSWLGLKEISLKQILTLDNQTPNVLLSVAKLVAELDPDRITVYVDKLEKVFHEIFDMDLAENLYKEMGLPPVLVHGDLWSSNVMWKVKDGKRELGAIIDWQLIHPGCAAEDLARYIVSSLSGEDRRKNWELLLQRYYAELEECFGRSPPFSLEQLKKSFIRLLPFHLIFILATLGPLVLERVKTVMPERYEKIKKAMADKAVAVLEDIFSLHESERMKNS